MKYIASIDIMPHAELLDPQGKTLLKNMSSIQVEGVGDIRVGKHIQMQLDADSAEEARAQIDRACQKLLANPIMESYVFTLKEA